MSKKLYLEPEMEVISLTTMQALLTGSGNIEVDGSSDKDDSEGGDGDF